MLSNEESVQTKLQRIALKASKDKDCQFTSLFHLMNEELLLECFAQLKGSAASGIDNITKEAYAKNLHSNVQDLLERLHRMAYKPQPVLRVYIPKPGSKKRRPLGIPALEDKLVQAGLVKILQAIYEQDFINDSYGFRPKRSCHDALRALSQSVEDEPVHYMVEADIKGFFDNVDQDQLMAFLQPALSRSKNNQHVTFPFAAISNLKVDTWGVPGYLSRFGNGFFLPRVCFLYFSKSIFVINRFKNPTN